MNQDGNAVRLETIVMRADKLTNTQQEVIEALENGDLIVRWNSIDNCQIKADMTPMYSHWILQDDGSRVYESTIRSLETKGLIKFNSYNDHWRTGIKEDHYTLQQHSLFGEHA